MLFVEHNGLIVLLRRFFHLQKRGIINPKEERVCWQYPQNISLGPLNEQVPVSWLLLVKFYTQALFGYFHPSVFQGMRSTHQYSHCHLPLTSRWFFVLLLCELQAPSASMQRSIKF